jgi:wyosine [tRNA(Phe)-imidazoG37] synthetase (radical SAM superfamily)
MIAFGPVPSRRLGRSLGINNIPPKNCTYACVYCQVGRTTKMQVQRRPFYAPEAILRAVGDKIAKAERAGESIDYLTFVPDGEPTLDVQLGQAIKLLRQFGIPIAVITNGSLTWREDVRQDLMGADWVSLKIDAVEEETWRRVSRPHGSLELGSVLDGMLRFAQVYGADLVTETMLVARVNDGQEHLGLVAGFLARLRPSTAYLSIPTRPPAEKWVRAPDEATLNQAYQVLSEEVEHVEYLVGYEGDAFAFTGNVEEDLLAITAVHPMRGDAVRALLARASADWAAVQKLVAQDQLVEVDYGDHTFYLRSLPNRNAQAAS